MVHGVKMVMALIAFGTGSDALKARSRSAARLESYSFEQFAHEYKRSYTASTEEYRQAKELFEASLVQIHVKNTRNQREGRSWLAGIHPFMDWTESERKVLNTGYKRSSDRRQGMSSLQLRKKGALGMNRSKADATSGGLGPEAGPQVRDQGNCGSCWAISAAEALEAQLQRDGVEARVSAQALVDCVPNPQHCGGSGGCDGATGELAYTYVRDHGIPMERDLHYTAKTGQCQNAPARQMVRASGWHQLPSNQVNPLMAAVSDEGPTVVAVDGGAWFDYDSGIFDGCSKDAILGHAVLAKGYGEENGKKYWLIQNSWGSGWGESGHIRLLRHGAEEDSYCGTDSKPSEGVGCDGGPSEVTVCGMCGLLFDPIVPQGVRVEEANGAEHSATPPRADSAEEAALAQPATDTDSSVVAAPEKPAKSTSQEMDDMLRSLSSA